MKESLIVEYEDQGTIKGMKPYLMWQSSPPNHLAFGQWSDANNHIAVHIDAIDDGRVEWYTWQFEPNGDGEVRLSPVLTVGDEQEAMVAAELWVRSNYKPVKRKARVLASQIKKAEDRKAVKEGRVIAGMPYYRFFMLLALIIAVSILTFLYLGVKVSLFYTLLYIVVAGSLGTVIYLTIEAGTNTLDRWTKRVRNAMKEVK